MKFKVIFLIISTLLFANLFSIQLTTAEDTFQWINDRERTKRPGGTVSYGAYVDEDVFIAPAAKVLGSASATGNSRIYGNAIIKDDAIVEERAAVYGNAVVKGNATVSGKAKVYGNAIIKDNAIIKGEARIFGKAIIGGYAIIEGDAIIEGYARIYDGNIKAGKMSPPEPESERLARMARIEEEGKIEDARRAKEKEMEDERKAKEKEMDLFNKLIMSIDNYSLSYDTPDGKDSLTHSYSSNIDEEHFYIKKEILQYTSMYKRKYCYSVRFSYEDFKELQFYESSMYYNEDIKIHAVKIVFKKEIVDYIEKIKTHTSWSTERVEENYDDYIRLQLPFDEKYKIYETAIAYKNHIKNSD